MAVAFPARTLYWGVRDDEVERQLSLAEWEVADTSLQAEATYTVPLNLPELARSATFAIEEDDHKYNNRTQERIRGLMNAVGDRLKSDAFQLSVGTLQSAQ